MYIKSDLLSLRPLFILDHSNTYSGVKSRILNQVF